MTYEIYYNDGGHCGPFQDFDTAYNAAINRLNNNTTVIEIRPSYSKFIGGFKYHNELSWYVRKPIDKTYPVDLYYVNGPFRMMA